MPHRILFCTIGDSPAIAVETVWWLKTRRPEGAWVPDQIIIVTTTYGLRGVRAELQAPDGAMAKLLGEPPVTIIHVPRRGRAVDIYRTFGVDPVTTQLKNWTENGEPLGDVATREDALVMSAVIWSAMVNAVKTPHSEVHVSFAGGRKTMSAHAVTAFSILGRFTDTASHVLVSGPFDEAGKPEIPCPFENPGFWRPDQGGTITLRSGRVLNPADAQVELVPVTVPLMRNRLGDMKNLENADLVEVAELVNLARTLQEVPGIGLIPETNEVQVGPENSAVVRKVGHAQFALLRLLLTAAKEGWPTASIAEDVGPNWLSFEDVAWGHDHNGTPVRDRMLAFLIQAEQNDIRGGSDDEESTVNAWKTRVIEEKSFYEVRKNDGSTEKRFDARIRTKNVNEILSPIFTRVHARLAREFGPDAASLIKEERRGRTPVRFRMHSRFPTQMMRIEG